MRRRLDPVRAWVKSSPTLIADVAGLEPRQGVLVRGVVAGEQDGRGAGRSAAGRSTPSPLEALHHGGLQHALAVLQVDPGRSCSTRGRRPRRRRRRRPRPGRVCRTTPAGLSSSMVPGAPSTMSARTRADLGEQLPAGRRRVSSPEDPGPSQPRRRGCRSAACPPAATATARRLARARPEMSAVVVRGSAASAGERRGRRAAGAGRPRRGPRGAPWSPSKSMATSRCSVRGDASRRPRGAPAAARAGPLRGGLRSHRGPPFRSSARRKSADQWSTSWSRICLRMRAHPAARRSARLHVDGRA